MRKRVEGLRVCGVIMLALAMLVSTGIVFPTTARATENSNTIAHDASTTSTYNQTSNISLVEIRAPPYYRLAFTSPRSNQLELSIRNGESSKQIVIVDLYHVQPDGVTESFLKTVHMGAIQPSQTKIKTVFDNGEDKWIPTQVGRNWIRGEIYVKGHGNDRILVNNFKESFKVVPGWRPVMQIDGDWIINTPTIIENRTIIVNGDVYVNANTIMSNGTLFAGDFIVSASQTIGVNQEINLWCNYSGEYKVEVKPNATLNVYGNITNDPDKYYYWFYMNGTLLLTKSPLPQYPPGIVENVMGSPDLSQPGGIICRSDNVLIENGAEVRNGATHGIYLMNGARAVIRGVKIHDNGVTNVNGGDGIVCVDNSAPLIQGNNISWNGRYGINAEGSLPTVNGSNTIQYNGQDGIYVKDVMNAEGRPNYTAGTSLGYFIWYDATGWHIRWSGNGTLGYFNGTITFNGLTAAITATQVNLDLNDSFTITGTSISFTATEDTSEEGFDFNFSGKSVNFDLFLNGAHMPAKVLVGSGINPTAIPFTLARDVKLADNAIVSNFGSGISCTDTNVRIIDNTISSNGLGMISYLAGCYQSTVHVVSVGTYTQYASPLFIT